jgi:hypothetical protein
MGDYGMKVLETLKQLRWIRVLLLALTLGDLGEFVILSLLPREDQSIIKWEGPLEIWEDRTSRGHRFAIQIDKKLLTARVNLFDRAFHSNVYDVKNGVFSRVEYFSMSTVLSKIGIAQPANILLRITQQDRIVFNQSMSQVRKNAESITETGHIWLVFGLVFFVCIGLLTTFKKGN